MNRTIALLTLLLYAAFSHSQSIRKNYTEMTEYEKALLVNAFFQLRNNGDLINDLATFHSDFFNFDGTFDPTRPDIHFNLPDEPERDIFFTWHRQQIFEVEQAMQEIDPLISIPYWNSSIDQSISSPLWDENFMGQFNTAWNLNRNQGATGALPTPEELSTVQSISSFQEYSNAVERGPVHEGAHRWTGGIMSGRASPRDPIFYLHHTFIDKIWQDWQENFNSSAFISTSMIRYDGTYNFNGQQLPLVNPNDIVESRSLGVFYAENNFVMLNNYSVSNDFNTPETFFYQYDIEIGNNFTVDTGKECFVNSGNRIVLKPGFHASEGSKFNACILATDSVSGNRGLNLTSVSPDYNTKGFDNIQLTNDAYTITKDQLVSDDFDIYPNPFENFLELHLKKEAANIGLWINDMSGKERWRGSRFNTRHIHISGLGYLPAGTYIIHVRSDGQAVSTGKIIKR